MGTERPSTSIQIGIGTQPQAATPSTSKSRRILVIGDFRGRGDHVAPGTVDAMAARRPMAINRDNLDSYLASLGIRCQLEATDQHGERLSFPLHRMQDFQPDQLFLHNRVFLALRQLREKLMSPATFDQAAQEVRSWGIGSTHALATDRGQESLPETSPPNRPATPPVTTPPAMDESLLDQVIQQTEAAPAPEEGKLPRDLRELIRQSVAPYRVERSLTERDELVECVDEVITQLMRQVMNAPEYRRLERGWRGLEFLTRRLTTGAHRKIMVLDASLTELADDFGTAGSLDATLLYRILIDEALGTAGGQPWSAVIVDFEFGASKADLLIAGLISQIADRAGVPLLAAASPTLLGCESFTELASLDQRELQIHPELQDNWQLLRSLPAAGRLALLLPRFLLRLPYGGDHRPIDSFAFEEMPAEFEHERLLWGNPVYLALVALEQAHDRSSSGAAHEVGDLPLYVYQDRDGQESLHPCTELPFAQRFAEALLALGVMPLLSVRNSNVVQIPWWQSLAGEPLTV